MSTVPPVPSLQQKAPVPPGNIPATRRQWIAVGACLLLVAAIAFTSLGGPASPKLRTGIPSATVTPMTAAELDAATRNLRQQQTEAEEARQKANEAAKRFVQSVSPGASAAGGATDANARNSPLGTPGENDDRAAAGRGTAALRQEPSVQDALRIERAKRDYTSLFSSNLALSLRPEKTRVSEATVPTNAEGGQPAETVVKPVEPGPKPKARDEESELKQLIADREIPKHVIFEGTILEAVLTNRLTGDFSGPVNCMLTTDVYSHNRQLLLIPQGSRVLGETKKVAAQNQDRLAVAFHRLIMPDGFSVDLDQFSGLDQAGAAALKDQVNHHYLQVFGTSVALGLLSGFELAGTATTLNANGIDVYRQGVSAQTSQNGMRVLESQLNRLPSVTIREGQRVKVYLSKDISLPAYAAHAPVQGL